MCVCRVRNGEDEAVQRSSGCDTRRVRKCLAVGDAQAEAFEECRDLGEQRRLTRPEDGRRDRGVRGRGSERDVRGRRVGVVSLDEADHR